MGTKKRRQGSDLSPVKGAEASEASGSLDLVFHPKALTLDDDRLGMVEQTVQDGASQRGVVVEDPGPVFIGLIGREDDRTVLVALTDDLEEQVGARLIDRQIADLVDT